MPDGFPQTVEIDGEAYGIRWQYYIILNILKTLQDEELNEWIRINLVLDLFFVDRIPEDIVQAFGAMMAFINAGTWSNGYVGHEELQTCMDWDIDAPFIWASMKQAYPYWDWSQAHWWEFKAAFDSLPDDAKINSVIRIRAMKLHKDMSAEQKQAVRELKEMYALPVKRRSAKEIEAELKARVGVKDG